MPMLKPGSTICKSGSKEEWKDSGRVRKLTPTDRFMAGMAYSLDPCAKNRERIMKRYDIHRSYVFRLRNLSEQRIRSTADPGNSWLLLDDNSYNRIVVALATVCQASLEEIQRIMDICFHKHMAIGKISGILNDYAGKAAAATEQINLSAIKSMALDEIYQGEQPVLTGIDLDSTYIFMIEPASDRQRDTWEIELLLKKELGLNPDLCISDACSSILVAVPDVFDSITVQIDVFHALRGLGMEVEKEIRQGEADLREFLKLTDLAANPRSKSKTRLKLEEEKKTIDSRLHRADEFGIMLDWLRELLAFPGYTVEEATDMLNWILDRIDERTNRSKLHNAVRTFRNNISRTLRYLSLMFQHLERIAAEQNIDAGLLKQIYYLRRNMPQSSHYFTEQKRIFHKYCYTWQDFMKITDMIDTLVRNTKRASSLVENLNSRIRKVMNAKRDVPAGFFALLQLYLNTKAYRRSQIPGRIGKSPFELLTGRKADFFELLGLKDVTIAQAIV